MHVLNFLPDDYGKRLACRRANVRCIILAVAALPVLGAAVGIVFLRAVAAAGARAVVEAQYQEASRRIRDLEQLEQRKTGLLHKVELSTALLERVPRSHLLARLTNHLPADTSLTGLSVQQEEVLVAGAPAKAPAPGVKAAEPPKVKVSRLRFRLDGLAQTDVQVASYIAHLAADPLFREVDLQFSEEFPYREGVTMRRFQLAFLLSPKAEKMLEEQPVAGLTATPPAGGPQEGE